MTRALRRIAAFGILLLGAAVTVSAAEIPPLRQGNPVNVFFTLAPTKIVCLNHSTVLIVDYWFNWSTGVLHPLTPTGTLLFSASRGTISEPTKAVGYGPDYLQVTYTATKVGHEKVTATVAYDKYTNSAAAEFEVRECNYHLRIGGEVTVEANGDHVYSRTWGEADISVGPTIEGEMDLNGMFNIHPLDEVLNCDATPSIGWGQVDISGTMLVVRGEVLIHLDLDYDLIKNFMGGSTTCKNTKTGKDVPFDRKEPDEVDPSEFMLTSLDYLLPQYKIVYDYGKGGGSAIYYLTPIK